ncbi:MAG: hypothetical protein IT437_06360 [Phycisphaerales bacterium]|nr:hypothetical protein [Phycisphaerales bacterium]
MLALLAAVVAGQPSFSVSFDKTVRAEGATGRIVVYLIREGASATGEPADGPFWDDPQPMFGISVRGLAPGAAAVVDGAATSFPVALSGLPAGAYRAQAVLDMHRDDSRWQREPGNLFSDSVTVRLGEADGPQIIPITLNHAVGARTPPRAAGAEEFTVRSKLLSDFRGRDVTLRAGVVFPLNFDPSKHYPAVYEIPGFGGNDEHAFALAAQLERVPAGMAPAVLARNCFWIVPDPESGNGHTLFADSANNGPCGRALVEELIPALEAKYPLIAERPARLLRGHSSGGWASLWLAMTYPGTFGGCWSSSPDPVDFRRFQLVDIYARANMYALTPAELPNPPRTGQMPDTPSARDGSRVLMTIRQENQMEEVLGPGNTSGQQWDSWQAVFGPRGADGEPAPLWDAATGVLDRAVAEKYRGHDIGEIVRADTPRYAALFQQRVRLVVGGADTYYLNEAVELLKPVIESVNFLRLEEGGYGYIKVLPGHDHGSVFGTGELQGFYGEMLEHLGRAGVLPR